MKKVEDDKTSYAKRLRDAGRKRATAFLDGFAQDVDGDTLVVDLAEIRDRLAEAFAESARDGLRAAGSQGGKSCRDQYGPDHYVEIGKLGGQRVRDLIAKGRERERKP